MIGFSLFLLLHLLAGLSLAVLSSPTANKPLNANHIFNAIHSAGRQWHESLHHNGLSFFLATIPAGTHLYHGRGDAAPVAGMDWLALEPEHAANFAIDVRNGSSDCSSPSSLTVPNQQQLSPKWTWPWHFMANEPAHNADVPGMPTSLMGHASRPAHDVQDSPTLPHTHPGAAQGQAPLAQPAASQAPPSPPLNLTLCPGYLHTYTTQRALHLLYIDGMSAAKSPLGTLTSQDRILLRQSALQPHHLFDDFTRARGLCEIARTQYAGKVEGFVRMEHGFEVVLCDFEGPLRTESVLKMNHNLSMWPQSGNNAFWQFLNAIADRYAGLGGGRLRVAVEGMVSVFAYPEIDVWADSEDGVLPNISRIGEAAAGRIAADVQDLVLNGTFPGDEEASGEQAQQQVDWRAVAELYVTRYARRLMHLTSRKAFGSAEQRANATRAILAVYLDDETKNMATDAALHRCTNAFIPPSAPPALPQKAITAVARQVCEALAAVMTTLQHDYEGQQQQLEALTRWLQWPEFKACEHGRGCAPGELCFVAIWPWGGTEDHERPRCWDEESLYEHMGEMDDYWRLSEVK